MKTIAQQLNVTDFPFRIRDKQGNEIYFEGSGGSWGKREFDSAGNEIYYENSVGLWRKREYDSEGRELYYEASDGVIIDIRPKDDVITIEGIKYKRIDE